MKNKIFNNLWFAQCYYTQVSQNYVAFLIYNNEDEMYEVINQDLYDHYTNEFDLDMRVIDFSC